MDRLRLWRYKKLANNEIVKEEKVIDDEDYNSCFQLKKNLKVREKIEILIFLHPTIKKVVEVDNADCNATKKPLSYKLEREELIINEVSTFFRSWKSIFGKFLMKRLLAPTHNSALKVKL